MYDSDLKNVKELAMAIITSIGAFREEYARPNLAKKINLKNNIYYPTEDRISVFLTNGLLKVLSSKGANKFYFSEPIFDQSGVLRINSTTSLEICELSSTELILTDENMDFVFMSLYDSFITLFFAKDRDINNIVESMKWEAIICDDRTKIDWYI